MNVVNLPEWLEKYCPNICSLLNQRARKNLPSGLVKYLSPLPQEELLIIGSEFPHFSAEYLQRIAQGHAEEGKKHLVTVDKMVQKLLVACGTKKVGDAYRRDISGVKTVKQVAELLCEIAFCAAICDSVSSLSLRPSSQKGTCCDVSFKLEGKTVFGEVKRYEDILQFDRSITKAPPATKPNGKKRPRSMDLYSKLFDIPRQFPDRTQNIVFIFHSSYGESVRYLQQALFGDSNFFKEPTEVILRKDGLFSQEKWHSISGCCLITIYPEGTLACLEIWENPKAYIKIEKPIYYFLDRFKPKKER